MKQGSKGKEREELFFNFSVETELLLKGRGPGDRERRTWEGKKEAVL